MMIRSSSAIVLLALLGRTNAQKQPVSDEDSGNLRRRLQEKRYPSLWAQDSSGNSQQGRLVSPNVPQEGRVLLVNRSQTELQKTTAASPTVRQGTYASLWATDTTTIAKSDSAISSPQVQAGGSLWSTSSQANQISRNDVTRAPVQNNNLRVASTVQQTSAIQQPTEAAKPQVNVPATTPNRRKFVSYESSTWEKYWLQTVEGDPDDRQICKTLLGDQISFVRDYLELLCTSKLMTPHQNWCVIDDGFAPLWFNTANTKTLELTFERPVPLVVGIPPPETVIPGPQHAHVLSKFTFKDELTKETYHEYVEPMIGHLRFPLQKCLHPNPVTPQYKNHYMSFRGWILPPPPVVRGDKALLFDATSTSWESNRGGFDLRFITESWKRHGVDVDNVWIFGEETSDDDFSQDVPEDMVAKTTFQKCSLASGAEEDSKDTPFLPLFINKRATVNDYVILKVDLGELDGRYNHLTYLDSLTDNRVDELIWEHKSEIMFLGDNLLNTDLTLRQSYELVLMMRRRGIRAHAWL